MNDTNAARNGKDAARNEKDAARIDTSPARSDTSPDRSDMESRGERELEQRVCMKRCGMHSVTPIGLPLRAGCQPLTQYSPPPW